MSTQYWNKREAFWWIASAALVIGYAVMVIGFGMDPAGILD